MRPNYHYQDRVNRALDYIAEHIDGDVSLSRLSAVGCFSPFHFHRIFLAITGETLNNYVRRVRLERAASLLRASPRKRITDVAIETGFAGAAEFSRAFKGHFGRTASSWDRRSPLENSKICKAPDPLVFQTEEELQRWKIAANVRVQVQQYTAFRYVYNRIYAPYAKNKLLDSYKSLTGWLANRGIDVRDVVVIGMSMDDPSITPSERCRYDLGVAFPQEGGGILGEVLRSRHRPDGATPLAPTQTECEDAGLSIRDFPPQQIGSLHCAGDISTVGCAWQYLYRIWLPTGEFEPADLPAMELFIKLPEEIGWEAFDIQLCIPVARLL